MQLGELRVPAKTCSLVLCCYSALNEVSSACLLWHERTLVDVTVKIMVDPAVVSASTNAKSH